MLDYSTDLFLRNCAGETTAQKPVWIMRQAGRYLPEYRAVRSQYKRFMDFCADPEACCEVTLQPLRRFQLDAAILFSDILTLLKPLGLDLEFVAGEGPVVSNPVRTLEAAQALRNADAEADLAYVYEAVRRIRKALDGRVPLLGFAGGPLTVASYFIEGGSSKELAETKKLAWSLPQAYALVMDRVTELTIQYLRLQVDAGAQALVLMDSWAGHFSAADYRLLVRPYTERVFAGVADLGVPLLHYANGAAHLLDDVRTLPLTGMALDWRADLAKELAKGSLLLQGNLDPCALYADPVEVRRKTREILDLVADRPHIMNLGHGVLPSTPIAGVEAFLAEIRKER